MTPIERDTYIKDLISDELVSKYHDSVKGETYGVTKIGYEVADILYPLTTGKTLKIINTKYDKYYNIQRALIERKILTKIYSPTSNTEELLLTEKGYRTIKVMEQLLNVKHQKREHQKELVFKIMGGVIKGMISVVEMAQKTAIALARTNENLSSKKKSKRKTSSYYD